MAELIRITPKKQTKVVDKCFICNLPFINIEITSSGRKLKHNVNANKKLRLSSLTEQKIEEIKVVLPEISSDTTASEDTSRAVCLNCYRKIQSIIKTEKDLKKNKQTIRDMYAKTRGTQKEISVKRLLRSPANPPMKKVFSPSVSIWKKTSLKSAAELKSLQIVSTRTSIPQHCPLILPSSQKMPIPLVCSEEEFGGKEVVTKAKKSLFSTNDSPKVEILIHYNSGVKTANITNQAFIKMCKVIHADRNVEKGLLNILKASCPVEVAACAGMIVQSECADLCRRQSDFMLRDKTYEGIFEFSWDKMHQQVFLGAPNTLHIVSAMVSSIPVSVPSKELNHILFAIGIVLHGRNREMTTMQYLNGMVLLHGGCTHRDIERLAKVGICVVPKTASNKLQSWQDNLDAELLKVKDEWSKGGSKTYQLVGDNWDKNIIPSYRTSQQNVQSLHLFNVIGIIDRIVVAKDDDTSGLQSVDNLEPVNFIPSMDDIGLLREELTFIVAQSVIENNSQLNNLIGKIYPDHLNHRYSVYAGMKTSQYSLGLFDCDEKKTQEVIKLMKYLSQKYVPQQDGQVIEEVFFGGDRLTDERIQVAQTAMSNGDTDLDRLEGFISKIEDFHRLMNFLEAIHRLTYNTQSSRDRGTMYYFRNMLNARNVKGEVKNSYRAYKHLYYTVFDAMCCILFFMHFDVNKDSEIPLPDNFHDWSNECKIEWINNVCRSIVDNNFFKGDPLEELRGILSNPDHEENYWVRTMEGGRFKCHFCTNTYSFVESLKTHEKNKHGYEHKKCSTKDSKTMNSVDELHDYVVALFRLTALHKNLDSAVNMGDGYRVVRSAKYETPLYHKTNKIKYLIGSVHLTAMVSGTLPAHQAERLVANRFVNMSGGRNNNISLDEYVEILNRDTKNTVSGFQTKESIIKHSKEFPHLINAVKHFDSICDVRGRKGYHRLPSYKADVQKVVSDLFAIGAFTEHHGRKLFCRKLVQANNPYSDCFKGLSEMIVRHKPDLPFRRLRNKHM